MGSIADMTRLPGALFIVDTMREHIAVKEAQRLNIPIFAMVDTNCDPNPIDFVIPANDDAGKSINVILTEVTNAIAEGLAERKSEKQDKKEGAQEEATPKVTVKAEVADAKEVKAEVADAKEIKAEPVAEEAKESTENAAEEPAAEENSKE